MTYQNRRSASAKLALSLVFLASAAAFANACSSDDGGEFVPFSPDGGLGVPFDATIPPFILPDGSFFGDDATTSSMDATVTGGGDGSVDDAGATDAGDASTSDAGGDAGSDGGMDAGPDASTDAGVDASTDAGVDASTDAGVDASTDAGVDASTDASVDAGIDAGYPYVRGGAPTPSSASQTGPYDVRNYTSGFSTTANFSGATIYYPSNATPPFALAVLVSDITNARTTMGAWASLLASHGIVAMTVDPSSALSLGAARSSALLDGLAALRGENTRSGSALKGQLDGQHAALLGWGAGAHGALLAASQTASLSAVVSLSDTDPQTFTKLAVPVLFLATQNELLAGNSEDVYAAVPGTTSKMVVDFNSAAATFGRDPTSQGGVTARFGLSWLKTFLEGDTRYRQFLLVPPGQATYTTTLK